MSGRLDEEYLENQTKINLSEIYTSEEIKLLKKNIPDINKITYLVTNNDNNSQDNSKLNNQQHQPKYRYYSSLRKTKNNSNISVFTDKEKFYSLILNNIKQYFEKEQNILLVKSVSLIINEFLDLSKIIKQNLIYKDFFKSIKNPKLIEFNKPTKSRSKTREKQNKSVKMNSITLKNDSIPNNNTTDVKKQLLFKTETEKQNNNKSLCEKNLSINTKKKESFTQNNQVTKNRPKVNNSVSKPSSSIVHMKNKNKAELNIRKVNINLNNNKSNISSVNTNSSNPKYLNNNFRLGSVKISLKKVNKGNRNLGIYDIINNRNEYNLVNTYPNKKCCRTKENKPLNNNTEKKENIPGPKFCIPSSFDSSFYSNIETQEFNIFKLEQKIGRVNILPLIGYYIFNTFNFKEVINYNKFEKWCQKISDGYIRKNYYHNDLHAADITQTCLLYFKLGEIEKMQNYNKSSLCSLFFSCICHDYQHPGVNNNYLKETKNKLSIRYNDSSILENMHISTSFELITNDKECDIFEGVDNNIYKEMRKEMISCVLATDMAFHNIYVEFLKQHSKEKKEGEKQQNKDDIQKYMNTLIHSADISNPTKLFDIYFEWAKLVVEEFWDQGDKEKKLNLPCSCDREKVTIYQSQLGFINFIEIPYFSLFTELYPKLKFFYDNLLNNKNILLSMQEKEKKEKEKGKENEKEKEK